MTDPCKHREQHPEGTVLPDDVALEHFDQCFTPERRLEAWTRMRQWSAEAQHCLMADHAGLVEEGRCAARRIAALTRELADRPRSKAARIAYRARARRRTRSHR